MRFVPFADELSQDGVSVVAYQDSWAQQVAELTAGLHQLLPDGVAIEHIGSTSVPGLAAKPCIDVTIVVADLATTPVEPLLVGDGFRRRPEPLNNSENLGGQDWPTMAFAPPVGGPSRNILVRPTDAATAPDLAIYGNVKIPARTLLMECAEHWAAKESA